MLRETKNIKVDIKYIFENIFKLYDSQTTLCATCALLGFTQRMVVISYRLFGKGAGIAQSV
jgi:hypothetical protein